MNIRRHPLSPRLTSLVLAGLVIGIQSACGGGDGPEDAGPGIVGHMARLTEIESGLLPGVVLEGEAFPGWTIQDRMEHYNVPGVSVALIDGGSMVWAKAYGMADPAASTPASRETLFQAASISKPIAALAALSMVEAGLLDLDAPVNDYLTSWTLPNNEFSADSAVTLRHLLTHSAGTTVWGFPGYRKDRPFAEGQPLANNAQVLDGEGNTDPVRLYKEPGTSWQYSGGGYTILEQLVEDVAGVTFHQAAAERALRPSRMSTSTYQQPLPQDRWAGAARGHGEDGTEIEGEWHTYPEQAAAGLWTTPSELAAVSVHLLGILSGTVTDGVLSQGMLEQMLSPNHDGAEGYSNWGLGFGLSAPGAPRTFGHGGANEGFRALWTVYRDTGQGVVIMTNGDRGSPLAGEIARAVAESYDWPGGKSEVRSRIRPDASVFEEISGEYDLEGMEDFIITLSPGNDGALNVVVPGQGTMVFYAASADEWFDLSDGDVMVFQRDADGNVIRAVNDGTTVMIKR